MVSTDQDCSLFTPLGQVWPLYPEREWVGLTDEEARVKFESWHKAEYVQPLERYGHTYKNMHVRNRWQGWLAANGIKEKNT
jgi:hypothetical protein